MAGTDPQAGGQRESDDGLAGAQAWLVVGFVTLLLLGIPAVLLVTTPQGIGSYGVYVALAMLPAVAFGLFGVWTALRNA
ncbi:MAG: hypothetical protein ABEI31_02995 [Halodesulfurarchaeum sp.]